MRTVLHDGVHPRWLEWLPACLLYGSFGLIIVLSVIAPVIAASLLVVYAVHWLVRAILMSVRLIVGYSAYRRDVVKNWQQKLATDFSRPIWRGIYHLVIVAVSKEDYAIVESTLRAIEQSEYAADRLIVVLATEERYAANGQSVLVKSRRTFGHSFAALIASIHPDGIAGEVKAKGGNITWAAHLAKRYLEKRSIPFDHVICTTLDADNRVHRKYFAALTYAYLKTEQPLYATYQPVPMFFNNIWDVPMPIRSISLGSSFWQIIEATRPHRLRNFSAHAQSFAALVATDFWSTKTIVEDGHQFWRSYFRFNGQHKVVPLSVPIYQDAVLSPHGYWATFKEQYLQKRRWAWGCSDIPYVLYHAWKNSRLPFWDKWLQAGRLIEGHFSWATTSMILAFFGWLPRILNPTFQDVVLGYTFPPLYSRILASALVGMAVTLTISTLLLPPIPPHRLKRSRWSVILEWISAPFLLPISNVLLSSIPAIDAQTRLALGKYLEFRVTEKHTIRQDLRNHPAAN
ncbi:hypothetical protein HY524_02075 [Candidatus Berkelbacteria bacterium]|nr:hypothetical protein [Candidatus Berkelbacteria bacterium]